MGGTRKLVVNAIITNKKSGESIEVPLHVDGGCEVAELVLLQKDVVALNISTDNTMLTEGVQADGSFVVVTEYERVLVELQTDTGDVWSASLEAAVISAPPPATTSEVSSSTVLTGVPGVDDTSRLLGYGGLNRFGLKQDFIQHKLVKVIRKV